MLYLEFKKDGKWQRLKGEFNYYLLSFTKETLEELGYEARIICD